MSSVSIFKQVDLGKTHAERIREMILNGDAENPLDYPIIMMHYSVKSLVARKLVSPIFRYRKDSRTYYVAALSGVLIIWYISEYNVPKGIRDFVVGVKADEIWVPHSPQQGTDFLASFLDDQFIKYAIDKG